MSLNVRQVLERVIRPALRSLGDGMASEAAERLVLGTAAVESEFRHLVQLGGGPAVGLWQMEPATYRDIWQNFLAYKEDLRLRVLANATRTNGREDEPDPTEMIWNLRLGAVMCRVHYLRDPNYLPDARNVDALAAVWKRHYNTRLGAGTEAKFMAAWHKLVGPIYG